MKKLLLLAVLVMSSMTVITACGGSGDDGPLDRADLVSAADAICTDTNLRFDETGIRGVTNEGVLAEMTATSEIAGDTLEQLEALEVSEEAQSDWDAYLEQYRKTVATDESIVADAKNDDTEAVDAGFTKLSEDYTVRQKAAATVGLKVCSQDPDLKIEETGTGPADDVVYAEPGNTVEEAAKAWVSAIRSGDCAKANDARHTDAGELDAAGCKAAGAALAGAEIVASEQYGPVGMAEIVAADVHYPTMFVEDLDGELRYGIDVVNDNGGLRPAPDGNDADETADAWLAAVREGDAEAFNATIFEPEREGSFKATEDDFKAIGQGEFGEGLVTAVRGSDAEVQPLGINANWAFYLVEGEEYDYVLNFVHSPGAGVEYRFSGYWPIPKAE